MARSRKQEQQSDQMEAQSKSPAALPSASSASTSTSSQPSDRSLPTRTSVSSGPPALKLIPEGTVSALLQYLGGCPHREVRHLVASLESLPGYGVAVKPKETPNG